MDKKLQFIFAVIIMASISLGLGVKTVFKNFRVNEVNLVKENIGFKSIIDSNLVTKKAELNLLFEPKMRGIKSENVIYYIENDMQTLSAYKNGKLKWQSNIISICGKPSVGESEIRVVKPKTEMIFIVFGKHSFAEVNKKNGETKFLGSD